MTLEHINDKTHSAAQRVFISYSHDSKEHENRVLQLADRLRDDGVEAWIDQYEEFPPQGWPLWMANELEKADWVIIVVSAQYQQRMMKSTPSSGKGVAWEGLMITQALYDAHSQNTNFIPLLFSVADQPHIPVPLRPFTYISMVSATGYEELYRRITEQPRIKAHILGQKIVFPEEVSIGPTRSASDRTVLANYSMDWLNHPTDVTSVEDYYTWHENPEFWRSGPGEMFAISNREIEALWAMSRYSTVYEVWLKRFLNCGGTASRVYVMADEYVNSSTHNLFLSVLYRHHLLGFKPRLAYLPQTERYRVECLKVKCDTYAVLNRSVCLLYQFPPLQYPMFARSIHKSVIQGAIQAHDNLISDTIDFETWFRANPDRQLSSHQIRVVEDEASRICEIASLGSLTL